MNAKRFTLHKGVDTLNIMDNTKFHEHIYINKSSKDMELLVKVLNTLHEENTILKQGITELAKNLQENVEFDRKQGRTQYPTHIVFYMINQFKELLE